MMPRAQTALLKVLSNQAVIVMATASNREASTSPWSNIVPRSRCGPQAAGLTPTAPTMRKFVFIFLGSNFESQLSEPRWRFFTQLRIRVSGTHSLTSGAPSHFLTHILILLTNFSPSGVFSIPNFFYSCTC